MTTLQLFVAANWLGKEVAASPQLLLPFLTSCPDTTALVEEVLVEDSEALAATLHLPLLLAAARIILVQTGGAFSHLWNQRFWALRCCAVQGAVQEERSDLLRLRTEELVRQGLAAAWGGEEGGWRALYLLEVARHHTECYRWEIWFSLEVNVILTSWPTQGEGGGSSAAGGRRAGRTESHW